MVKMLRELVSHLASDTQVSQITIRESAEIFVTIQEPQKLIGNMIRKHV